MLVILTLATSKYFDLENFRLQACRLELREFYKTTTRALAQGRTSFSANLTLSSIIEFQHWGNLAILHDKYIAEAANYLEEYLSIAYSTKESSNKYLAM